MAHASIAKGMSASRPTPRHYRLRDLLPEDHGELPELHGRACRDYKALGAKVTLEVISSIKEVLLVWKRINESSTRVLVAATLVLVVLSSTEEVAFACRRHENMSLSCVRRRTRLDSAT